MAYSEAFCVVTIACEADAGTQLERECVAHSLLNRVSDGRWKHTPEACALQRMQYSEYNDDAADNSNLIRVLELPDNHPIIMVAREAWQSALMSRKPGSGLSPDPTGGATHFLAPKRVPVRPKWAQAPSVLMLTTPNFEFWGKVP